MLIAIAGIARSSYYYHANRLCQPDKYAAMKAEIFSIYQEHKGRMGYRRIKLELHNRSICISHKTVLRLMRQLGLYCRVRIMITAQVFRRTSQQHQVRQRLNQVVVASAAARHRGYAFMGILIKDA